MASSNSQHRCVFVGNIPYDATQEQIVQICEEVGPVVSFRLVVDKDTGKPKGYGFCEYKDEETALSARRNLQGYEINGRQLRVDFAENDKAGAAADRNREQGRGGPGMLSGVDLQKPIGSPAILGDSAHLHQPMGISVAATAASVMAGALSNAQNGAMSQQSCLPGQIGLRNDQLTPHLARMSKTHLYEIMSEMKAMATQDKELARQLLLSSPQLSKALFQAQIMLGMVNPQVLQMQSTRQSPGSLLQTPPLQEGTKDHKLALFPPLLSQQNFHPSPPNPMMRPCVPESVSKFAERPAQVTNDARNSMYPNTSSGLTEKKRRMNDAPDDMNQPWKLARLEDGRDVRRMANQPTSIARSPGSIQAVGTGSLPANRISNTEGMQYPEKQALQAPADESALLEQVMNLTPEQLSSLTLEQRQQVIQLQKLLGNR